MHFLRSLIVLFSILGPKIGYANARAVMEFTDLASNQELAKELFVLAGAEAKVSSDYIWTVDAGKALLNPLVLAYRYEGRRVNPMWTCFELIGIDHQLSNHSWASGFFGMSFREPPEYFCEGVISLEYQGIPTWLTVNTSSWETMIKGLTEQAEELSAIQERVVVETENGYRLEYLKSEIQDLSCMGLETLTHRGRSFNAQRLMAYRQNLLPSYNPPEYKMLRQLPQLICQVFIDRP